MIRVNYVNGDLLEFPSQYIAHQCNTETSFGKGLSSTVFRKYPDANDYKRNTHGKPGTIKVHGRVINMFAQVKPGKPSRNETYNSRFILFERCLSSIAEIPGITSVAFPKYIGCGLAGGDWTKYRSALESFAESNPHIEVTVVAKYEK